MAADPVEAARAALAVRARKALADPRSESGQTLHDLAAEYLAVLSALSAQAERLAEEIDRAEVAAVAGMIGMDPAQGRERVYDAVRERLRDRRRALDGETRALREAHALRASVVALTADAAEERRVADEALSILGKVGDALDAAGVEVSAAISDYPAHVADLAAARDEWHRLTETGEAAREVALARVAELEATHGVALGVVTEALALWHRGYDGPFMGDDITPLLHALAAYERAALAAGGKAGT